MSLIQPLKFRTLKMPHLQMAVFQMEATIASGQCHKYLGIKCHWGSNVSGSNVTGDQMSWDQMSWEQMSLEIKWHLPHENKCLLGSFVRDQTSENKYPGIKCHWEQMWLTHFDCHDCVSGVWRAVLKFRVWQIQNRPSKIDSPLGNETWNLSDFL